MFGLDILAKIIKILRSDDSPNQIALGFALGMVLGLTPFWTLHNILIILVLIIFNINLGSALLSFALFSGLAYLFDPLFHNFGYYLLVDVHGLHPLWVYLYQFPVVALSHYNNTVVMGSLVSALILFIPVFFAAKYFVFYYRAHLDEKIQKTRIVKFIKASKFYSVYKKIEAVRH